MTEANRDKHTAYWATIPGSDKLLEIYGYYPTFHDASAVAFHYDGNSQSLTIAFEYWDEVKDEIDEEQGKWKITLRWIGVLAVDLKSEGTDISNVDFLPGTHEVVTTLAENYGLYGTITSKSVEVVSVDVPTERSQSYLSTMSLTITTQAS